MVMTRQNLLIALVCAALCGCAHRFSLNEALNPFYNPPAPSSASKFPRPDFSIPARTPIPGSPRQIKADKTYPPTITLQKMIWTDGNFAWHIRFPPQRYAYASCEMKYPLNLVKYKNKLDLTFRFYPAKMADFISIALLDNATNSMDEGLADYVVSQRYGWAKVVIPLSAFSGQAGAISADRAESFDWSQIREIRFISRGGRLPAKEFIAHDLTIERR